jgi:hypothetical protein
MTMVSSRTAPAQSVSQFLLSHCECARARAAPPSSAACRHPRAEETGAVECAGRGGLAPRNWDMGRGGATNRTSVNFRDTYGVRCERTHRPLRHHVGLASVHAPAHQAPHRLLHAGGLLAGPASPGIRWNRHSNRSGSAAQLLRGYIRPLPY